MPKITLQLTVSDDMQRQLDLLCSDETPIETILQQAVEFGLQDIFDVASNRYRDFMEQRAAHATGMFARLFDSRKIVATVKPSEARPVTLSRADRRFTES